MDQFRDAASKIDYQPNTSIDEFLYDNQSLYDFGKLFSSYHIGQSMYTNVGGSRLDPKINSNFLRAFIDPKSGTPSWIATLAKCLASGCSDEQDLAYNNLTIVTFNYDTIIERALLSLFRNTERFKNVKDLAFVPIFHVNGALELANEFHGAFAQFANGSQIRRDYLRQTVENSKQIFMINEPVSEKVKKARERALAAVLHASKVYSIGFAFDPRNVELVGLDKLNTSAVEPRFGRQGPYIQKLFALNYDGNISFKKRISDLGATPSEIDGSNSRPMGCSVAAGLGFFDL